MNTPAMHIIHCGECEAEICNATLKDHSGFADYVCSLAKGHAGSHLDKTQIARWSDPAPSPGQSDE